MSNDKREIATRSGKRSVPNLRSGVLLNRFNGLSVFQLRLPSPLNPSQAGNDKDGIKAKSIQNGANSGVEWLAIQLTFDADLWAELPDKREESESGFEQISNVAQKSFWSD